MKLPAPLLAKVQAFGQEIVEDAAELRDNSGDLHSIEVSLLTLARALVTTIVVAIVARRRDQLEASPPCCERCRIKMRSRGEEARSVSLAYGDDLNFLRQVWECGRCKGTYAPVDKALGLRRDSWSPMLRQFFCLGAALLPGKRAAESLGRVLSRHVSARSLMDVAAKEGAAQVAQDAAQGMLAEPYKPHKKQRWYVMLDGSASHVDKGWHEAQLGVIFPEDARVHSKKPSTGPKQKRKRKQEHYRLKWKRVFGCINNWETFSHILTKVLVRLRIPEIATQVVVITDGASVLRSVIALVLPDALLILDWYHATLHLWTCAKTLYGDGTDATRRWAKKYERMLRNGRVRDVIRGLERAKRHHQGKKKQEALSDLIRYYSNNADRMAYDEYRRQGLLIGSGPIEGAHRHIHHQRFKLAGMRHWCRERKNALLNLRLIYLNGDWDTYWRLCDQISKSDISLSASSGASSSTAGVPPDMKRRPLPCLPSFSWRASACG